MMTWIAENWLYITFAILIIDKLVTITPKTWHIGSFNIGRYDDLIWSAVKGAFLTLFDPNRKPKKS